MFEYSADESEILGILTLEFKERNIGKDSWATIAHKFLIGFEMGWKSVKEHPNQSKYDPEYAKFLYEGTDKFFETWEEGDLRNFSFVLGVISGMFRFHPEEVKNRLGQYFNFAKALKSRKPYYWFIAKKIEVDFKKLEAEFKMQEEKRDNPKFRGFKIDSGIKKKYLVYLEYYKNL